jgi:adenosylmethionine-8-amino-7-oxononanoate aminotransferase
MATPIPATRWPAPPVWPRWSAKRDQLIEQSLALAPVFEDKLHALKGSKHVVDIRNCGLAGAIQLAARDGDAAIRPYETGLKLWQAGFYVRFGGDTLQFGPSFNTTPASWIRCLPPWVMLNGLA